MFRDQGSRQKLGGGALQSWSLVRVLPGQALKIMYVVKLASQG
jgi:hypothetical protein